MCLAQKKIHDSYLFSNTSKWVPVQLKISKCLRPGPLPPHAERTRCPPKPSHSRRTARSDTPPRSESTDPPPTQSRWSERPPPHRPQRQLSFSRPHQRKAWTLRHPQWLSTQRAANRHAFSSLSWVDLLFFFKLKINLISVFNAFDHCRPTKWSYMKKSV